MDVEEHEFTSKIVWEGGEERAGHLDMCGQKLRVRVPDQFGGSGPGTTPENLMVCAINSCVTFTFLKASRAILLEPTALEVKTTLKLAEGPGGGHEITDVEVEMNITVPKGKEDKALKAAKAAGRSCLMLKAMQGNVAVKVAHNIKS